LLQDRIVACTRCPRLTAYREQVAQVKVRRYRGLTYWGRPVPSFGDPNARLFILGLAPAAHGGNRTGRVFTGDDSGSWLIRALYETGFANQATSTHRADGLKLSDAYITALVHCAPPNNRPLASEMANCAEYWMAELRILPRVQVVLTLGRLAFAQYLARAWSSRTRRPRFAHGAFYEDGDAGPALCVSYHPSRQNTQTGKLTWEAWIRIFHRIRRHLRSPASIPRTPA
jgi:uracil-DNA glycosylase family 4